MAKPQDISLSLVRTFKAPPAKVFAALTQAQALKMWMGPTDEFEVPLAEADAQVGGRYRIIMRGPDGTEHRVGGAYREVEPDRRLVFTWAWEGDPDADTLVTIDLRHVAGGTEMTLTHTNFGSESSRDMHRDGWNGCLNRFERHLAA